MKMLVLDGLFEAVFDFFIGVAEVVVEAIIWLFSLKTVIFALGAIVVGTVAFFAVSARAQSEDVIGATPRTSVQARADSVVTPAHVACKNPDNSVSRYHFPEYVFWANERGTFLQKRMHALGTARAYPHMNNGREMTGYDPNKPYLWYSTGTVCMFTMAGS